jgi:hypothetical protein
VDFSDSFLGYIVQYSGSRGASLFTHFRPFSCTFFLSKSPQPFFNNAFSLIQQALFTTARCQSFKNISHRLKAGCWSDNYFIKEKRPHLKKEVVLLKE